MKCFKYIKSNAFTVGNSQGNPAACLFVGADGLSDSEMQAIAREHKGAVMETVFLSPSAQAHCLLTYYSSECEVDFCGHYSYNVFSGLQQSVSPQSQGYL